MMQGEGTDTTGTKGIQGEKEIHRHSERYRGKVREYNTDMEGEKTERQTQTDRQTHRQRIWHFNTFRPHALWPDAGVNGSRGIL